MLHNKQKNSSTFTKSAREILLLILKNILQWDESKTSQTLNTDEPWVHVGQIEKHFPYQYIPWPLSSHKYVTQYSDRASLPFIIILLLAYKDKEVVKVNTWIFILCSKYKYLR